MKEISFVRRAALAAVVVGAAGIGAAFYNHQYASGLDTSGSLATVQQLSDTFAAVAQEAAPAVVFIEVEKEVKGSPAGFFWRGPEGLDPGELFGFPLPFGFRPPRSLPFGDQLITGQGSGFVISPDGYIVTNHHVVGDADRVKVTFSDGEKRDAKIVGTDQQTDVALIKVEGDNLPTITLGDSDRIRVGEWVLAIGNPFGQQNSVTSGIVSARGRSDVRIVDYADFIQTDAAINPGNSGGPLINMSGEVVGVNTAIMSRSGGSEGIGFAIPSNMVKYIVDQLRTHGSVTRGFLGIGIQNLTPELAAWFKAEQNRGVLVAEVVPDSPAEKAGLKKDDVIIELDGKPVRDSASFRNQVAMTDPGKDVNLTILRDGERMTKRVEVGTLDNETAEAVVPAKDDSQGERLGMLLEPLTEETAKRLGYEGLSGVVVSQVAPGSPAMRAGIRPGALITEVNKKEVANIQEFRAALKEGRNGSTLLRVREGNSSRYVAIEIE